MSIVHPIVEAATEPLPQQEHIADAERQHNIVWHLASLWITDVHNGDGQDAQKANGTNYKKCVHIDVLHHQLIRVCDAIVEGVWDIRAVSTRGVLRADEA